MIKNIRLKNSGITLIALVITIIILLILAGVTLNLTFGENGLLGRTKESTNEYNKQEATEKINFKVTNAQIHTYAEKQRMPTLQEIANILYNDNEIEYVNLKKKELASNNTINIGDAKSIFTKLTQYPYEFEINSSLQLASIDGVKLETSNGSGITEEELDKKIDEKLANSYQRLRLDNFEEVPFTNGAKYVATCDGYYCLGINVKEAKTSWNAYVNHYTKEDELISMIPAAGYYWGYSGGEIYMKKGEYITFYKEANVTIVSSKFFYAEGCTPETTEPAQ